MSEDNGPDGVASAHRVFGRRKGKKLREHQSALIQTLLPRVNATEFLGDREKAPAQKKDVWLEVGFGGGEHLAAQAAAHPETDFIGCEPFMNGVGKILALIEARSLGNIRVHADDAAALIARLPNASVDRLYILFPDPWPKRRQRKRRFIDDTTLPELARILKSNAEFRFATDIDDYAGWVLARVLSARDLEWRLDPDRRWLDPWPDHNTTRYEQKARNAGRAPMFFTFVKKG